MKKKFITLLSAVMLLSVGFNTTACGDDDDDDTPVVNDSTNGGNDNAKEASVKQGTADGKAFAELYTETKAKGFTLDNTTNIISLINSAKSYRNSEDKAYKAAYLAAASGATGLAEGQIEKLLGSESVEALLQIVNAVK
ncbi:MAG: hypothetical protein MJZ23_00005 [Paludibacteraceae bacterium]|nr:hypothetical protein [Paludibacteraceae bacterium]